MEAGEQALDRAVRREGDVLDRAALALEDACGVGAAARRGVPRRAAVAVLALVFALRQRHRELLRRAVDGRSRGRRVESPGLPHLQRLERLCDPDRRERRGAASKKFFLSSDHKSK